MAQAPQEFDFWYAVNNTEVLELPRGRLETFGSTLINYRLVTELMDSVGQVRVREGRIQSFRPEILTPQAFTESPLEGFQTGQAADFIRWLREHEADLVILKYGFKIRHDHATESIVHDSLDNVVARVRADLKSKDDPLGALVLGVDEPWRSACSNCSLKWCAFRLPATRGRSAPIPAAPGMRLNRPSGGPAQTAHSLGPSPRC